MNPSLTSFIWSSLRLINFFVTSIVFRIHGAVHQQQSPTAGGVHAWFRTISRCLVFTMLLYTPSGIAQSLNLPDFSRTNGTVLGNTHGNWVRINPGQPNNIDLLETRIFEMPSRGNGIASIEFKLVGGDGGTARFQWGLNDKFANGGQGGEITYTLNLGNNNAFNRPFLVTFGKKGESSIIHRGFYCSAGGGGSTGMAWLVPGAQSTELNFAHGGYLIAAAGGGGGGYATQFNTLNGKSATEDARGQSISGQGYRVLEVTSNQELVLTLVSGGSSLRTDNNSLNSPYCCTNALKRLAASGSAYNVFTTQTGLVVGSPGRVLQSITLGQGGGKPTTIFAAAEGTSNTTGFGLNAPMTLLQNGGRGGSGFSGGGAGSSTTEYPQILPLDAGEGIPTGGAGGTGSDNNISRAAVYPNAADAGWNSYSVNMLQDVTISSRAATPAPQSGYFMYRTIQDTEPPVINLSNITLKLGNGKSYPHYSSTTPITMATLESYIGKVDGIYDNDGIKSITFSETGLTCFHAGQTIPLYIAVTDFAGNTTNGVIMATVQDPFVPVPILPETSSNALDPDLPARIDVSRGAFTLTAANFPKAYDGCKSTTTVHFTPTTFNCSHAGTSQQVSYYYTDSDGNNSLNYTKTFHVIYSETNRLYVDHGATGANNGSSWTDAFTSLQDALRNGCNNGGREIYVAKGTYYPDQGYEITQGDRNASFTLRENDKLYGGFPSGGDVFANRKAEANPVILSGEIVSPLLTDNSSHVITIAGNNTILEGFTVRGGFANNNAGGGIILQQTEGTLTSSHQTVIRNCKFLNNYALLGLGGAVYADYKNKTFTNYLYFQNCLFDGNTADNGGAVYLNSQHTEPNMRQEFINCVFVRNTASMNGGALFSVANENIDVTNCTFGYNIAGASGGAVFNHGTVHLHNSILYFNTAAGIPNEIGNTGSFEADYSNIQGSGGSGSWVHTSVTDQGNNIDTDPLFYSAPFDTSPILSLTLQSPSRNGGLNAYNNEPFDILGNNVRISQNVIDMGAFETNSVVYVAADASGGGDGNTWATALNNLNDGIQAAGTGIMQRDIWIKEGIYRPDRLISNSTPTPDNRENSFYLSRSLKIYGGFAGNETSIAHRKIGLHPTILSGDVGVLNNAQDNVYHVITAIAGDSRLDGLIIEDGNANGPDENSSGGGIIEYPAGNANNTVINCVFRNNHASGNGGAVYVTGNGYGVSNFVQCIFYGNTAARGAVSFTNMNGFRDDGYSLNYFNVTALGNVSNISDAGVFEAFETVSNRPANVNFYNALLAGNLPKNYNDVGNPGHINLANTYTAPTSTDIFENTSSVAGTDGKIMTDDDGIRLTSSSPAINYGDNSLAHSGSQTDITGGVRIIQNMDAGAYESPFDAALLPHNGVIYVKQIAAGTRTGTSWANATADLHNAIHAAGVQKVFVALGNYKVGEHSFMMKNGVAIFGGFDPENGITDLSHKRIMPNTSHTQGSVLNGETSRPVIWNVFNQTTAMDHTAVLDGFTITKGAYSSGAGIRNVHASPSLNNLVIWNNIASMSGGGIYNDHSNPRITNTLISGNGVVNVGMGAGVFGAGVMNTASSQPVLTNVTLTGNILVAPLGTMKGAGMFSKEALPKIFNSIIWNNQKMDNPSISGADLENEEGATLTLKNSITQGYSTGNATDHNKVNVNPLLSIDYHPTATSPTVDAGDNALYPSLNSDSKDLAGNPRVLNYTHNENIDMGAYENQRIITRWYVNQSQDNPLADGTSWATAFASLEDGLEAANTGDTLWVAKGIYTPAITGSSFRMKSDVKIYGGFAASEQTLAERNLGLGKNAILQGNGNRVISNNQVNSQALLDGFVIQNGNSTSQGGGVLNNQSQAQFRNVVFVNNHATDGGAMANINSQTHIQNAVFYSNEATQGGGAIFDQASSTSILHATFYNNLAQHGAVSEQRDGSSLVMDNSISWGNQPVEWHNTGAASTAGITHSLLQNGHNGTGNIASIDPKFSDPDDPAGFDDQWFTADDGLTATYKSVYVNKAENTLSTSLIHDITGAARIQNATADMGAYENTAPNFCQSVAASGSSKLYVNANVPASGDGFSWNGALKTLNEAVEMANNCDFIDGILIAEGTYYPTGYQAAEDRTQSFVISRDNLHLSGGFNSHDPTIRNTGLYPTILSGNLLDNAVAQDNSFHVLTLNNASDNITLEGLTIKDGMADGTTATDQLGGGIYNVNSTRVTLTNSVVANNTAALGGGIYNQSADITLTNVAITGNTATSQGGGFYSESGNPILTNVTVVNNTASVASSGAIHIQGGAMQVKNAIIYGGINGSYTAAYSLIQGNTSTTQGNLNAAGMTLADIFADPGNGEYKLKACAPPTNAGTTDVSGLNLPVLDPFGSPRIFGDRVDMGAYENATLPADPGMARHRSEVIRMQTKNGTTAYFNSCNELLLSVKTTGATDDIAGITSASVWIDDIQPPQYVRRHYEITPDDHAETTTGMVTLYFTQADFDAFNLKNTAYPLPDGPTGNLSNLLIEKRGGVSADGTGAPQTYPGESETISNVDILWSNDHKRWEVSFQTTGFSGFFVKTTSAPLPVRWLSFDARLNDQFLAVLNWKTDETNASHYEVERSVDARDFRKVAVVNSQGNGIHPYTFTDQVATTGPVYYRIRQVDLDGSYGHSRIIGIASRVGVQLYAFPNPVRDRVTVQVGEAYIGTNLLLINSAGVPLRQVMVTGPDITFSMERDTPGVYLLYTFDGQALRLIRE